MITAQYEAGIRGRPDNAPAAMERGFGTRWWIVLALSFGPAVATGFARFAYALVLPAMREQLVWTYSQAGWIHTGNALGYLAGALLTMRLVSTVGARRLFSAGMGVTALALAASGFVSGFAELFALRSLTGVSSAIAFICGGVLAGTIAPHRPQLSTTVIVIYFGGAGVGLVLSGAGIPWLLEQGGNAAWPYVWLSMGAVATAMAAASAVAAYRIEEPSTGASRAFWPVGAFRRQLAGYFLFAAGYVAYMTFMVAWMKEHGATASQVSIVWSALGLATLLAPIVWTRPLATWRGGRPLAASMLVVAIGAALPLVSTSFPALLASAVLVGGALFIPPSAVTTLVKKSLPKPAWGSAVAVFTVTFAVGQSVGPVATGWVTDLTGSLYAGLAGSVLVLLAGAAVALGQRDLAD